MRSGDEVVITGVGVISPLGIGKEPYWQALRARRSGVRRITQFDPTELAVKVAGEVTDFDPKKYVRPRKSLKVMSRDAQFAVTTSDFALEDAGLDLETIAAERIGTVYGADIIRLPFPDFAESWRVSIFDGVFDIDTFGSKGMFEAGPLSFLKNLPNGLACHVSIKHDARGPNNTMQDGDVSPLLAVWEGARVIERGQADVMFCGGASSRTHPLDWCRSILCEELHSEMEPGPRPFDAHRKGLVRGEGGATFLLERRSAAEARGAAIRARILGMGTAAAPEGRGLRLAIEQALRRAGLAPGDISHVNAHGLGTRGADRCEAQVLRDLLGDVPVTAPKSYFGELYSGSGAVELAASVLALAENWVPPVLNFTEPDPGCPVNVISGEGLAGEQQTALVINHTEIGQAAAILIGT